MIGRGAGEGDQAVARYVRVGPVAVRRLDLAEIEAADRAAVGVDEPVRGGGRVVAAGEEGLAVRHPDGAVDVAIELRGDLRPRAAGNGSEPDGVRASALAAARMPVGDARAVGRRVRLRLVLRAAGRASD